MAAETELSGPHAGAEVIEAGTPLYEAHGALILLHGRGASATDILRLGYEIAPEGVALLAPQAVGHTWYPKSFLAPIQENEPWLSSALGLVAWLVERCLAVGIPPERLAVSGFSQGACLSTEFVARHPRRYAAVAAFTGGLIGPPGTDLHHEGRLDSTPVLFSSGDPDPHVPWARVQESARELEAMGAQVEVRQHVLRPHTVLPEELKIGRELMARAFAGTRRLDAGNRG
jgi:phospholipase/carboxylesterase